MFAFVTKDLSYSRPEITVRIHRELAARLGISMEDIGQTLQIMLGEAETNRFSMEGRSYKVIPQADRGFRLNKEWLERYYVRTTERVTGASECSGHAWPKCRAEFTQTVPTAK